MHPNNQTRQDETIEALKARLRSATGAVHEAEGQAAQADRRAEALEREKQRAEQRAEELSHLLASSRAAEEEAKGLVDLWRAEAEVARHQAEEAERALERRTAEAADLSRLVREREGLPDFADVNRSTTAPRVDDAPCHLEVPVEEGEISARSAPELEDAENHRFTSGVPDEVFLGASNTSVSPTNLPEAASPSTSRPLTPETIRSPPHPADSPIWRSDRISDSALPGEAPAAAVGGHAEPAAPPPAGGPADDAFDLGTPSRVHTTFVDRLTPIALLADKVRREGEQGRSIVPCIGVFDGARPISG